MTSPITDALQQEWITLQNQYDSYEKFSLVIKLGSAAICSLVIFHEKLDFVIVGLCLVMWMLDAIWKTFQSRTSDRLLLLEAAIKRHDGVPMQLHSDWLENRPSVIGLVIGYIKGALTPTVMLPHAAIVGIAVVVARLV
ncbi:hypothetical protein OAP14_07755 [Aliiglaciecola sp.]|nr:hypothetical protein [Aliiglaciecola sp.]